MNLRKRINTNQTSKEPLTILDLVCQLAEVTPHEDIEEEWIDDLVESGVDFLIFPKTSFLNRVLKSYKEVLSTTYYHYSVQKKFGEELCALLNGFLLDSPEGDEEIEALVDWFVKNFSAEEKEVLEKTFEYFITGLIPTYTDNTKGYLGPISYAGADRWIWLVRLRDGTRCFRMIEVGYPDGCLAFLPQEMLEIIGPYIKPEFHDEVKNQLNRRF